MRKTYKLLAVIAASLLFLCFSYSLVSGQEQKKEPAKPVGSKDEAKWTKTTTEAATTPENKKVINSGKVTTVTGEVVEVSCYLQLGKRGAAHIPCGTDCIKNGQPVGIVTDKGELYLIMAEQHDPRRKAEVDIKATFIPLLAKTATVTGMLTEHNGYKAIFIQGKPTTK
jgi:hypothetical protein